MIRSTLSLRHHKQQQQLLVLRRCYQSETLQWASQHRVLAQQCLNLPATSVPSGPPTQPIRSWEAYLEWRQWYFPSELPAEDTNKAVGLVSHVLSAPLTAATQLFSAFFQNQSTIHFSGTMNWCCVGARAEASLPVEYWKEILVLWAHTSPNNARCTTTTTTTTTTENKNNNKLDVTIDFVGPDVLRRPSTHLTYEGHSLTLRWLYNGTFHEYLQRMQEDPYSVSDDMVHVDENTWDAYILFNPGLGHKNLMASWEPTLQLLLSSGSTVGLTGNAAKIVLTAHSSQDAIRDTECLTNYLLQEAPLYKTNPFASRVDYEDPFEPGHIVRPNQYAYTLVWQ
eukprot:scaffold13016_cov154-Amphora_coffeaeformis.AAC.11